jgi:hypothetical protein
MANEKNPNIERMARAGYLTKGILYALLGALSMQAAWQGGKAAGSEDAARTAAAQPFGAVLVGTICVGVFAYAVWNVLQAVYDTEFAGNDWKGLLKRAGYVLSSLLHLGLAWTCARLATSGGMSHGQRAPNGADHQLWLDRVLASDFGPALLTAAAVGVLVFGAVQLHAAYTGKFMHPLNLAEASTGERRAIELSGKVGFTARGLVFLVLGYTLVRGGLAERAVLADGVKGALNEIATSSVGAIGLFIVSVGLTLYGAFLVGAARYRRVTAARVQVPKLAAS